MGFFDWARRLWSAPMEPVTGHRADKVTDLEVDGEGWLVGRGVRRLPSVRHSSLSVPTPIALMWHYTATDPGTAGSLAKRIQTYRSGHDRAASWHVCVGVDGTLWQSVPFLRGAWHCARGVVEHRRWHGDRFMWDYDVADSHRINACAIGVELEGHGKTFSNPQVAGAMRLLGAVVEAYQIHPTMAVLAHSHFDPSRRRDPGPVWRDLLPLLLRGAYNVKRLPDLSEFSG